MKARTFLFCGLILALGLFFCCSILAESDLDTNQISRRIGSIEREIGTLQWLIGIVVTVLSIIFVGVQIAIIVNNKKEIGSTRSEYQSRLKDLDEIKNNLEEMEGVYILLAERAKLNRSDLQVLLIKLNSLIIQILEVRHDLSEEEKLEFKKIKEETYRLSIEEQCNRYKEDLTNLPFSAENKIRIQQAIDGIAYFGTLDDEEFLENVRKKYEKIDLAIVRQILKAIRTLKRRYFDKSSSKSPIRPIRKLSN